MITYSAAAHARSAGAQASRPNQSGLPLFVFGATLMPVQCLRTISSAPGPLVTDGAINQTHFTLNSLVVCRQASTVAASSTHPPALVRILPAAVVPVRQSRLSCSHVGQAQQQLPLARRCFSCAIACQVRDLHIWNWLSVVGKPDRNVTLQWCKGLIPVSRAYSSRQHGLAAPRWLPLAGSCARYLRTTAALHEDVTIQIPSMGDSISEGSVAEIEKQPGARSQVHPTQF